MANGDDVTGAAPELDTSSAGTPMAGAQGAAPSPMGPGGPGGMQPGGALAALARRGQGPQTSAPGMGNMASGLMSLKTAVDMLQTALPNLPAGSQQHKDTLKALTTLSRHLPQGMPTAGVQQTQIQDLLRNTIRNAIMQRLIGQQGQGGQQGGGPGGMPAPPAPSTPLPGA